MNTCRKCWKEIEKIWIKTDLWCRKCKEEINNDFELGMIKDFDYYFRYYIEHKDGNHNKNLTYYMANNSNTTNDYNSY